MVLVIARCEKGSEESRGHQKRKDKTNLWRILRVESKVSEECTAQFRYSSCVVQQGTVSVEH